MAATNDPPVTETHETPRGTGINSPTRTRYWTLRCWSEIVSGLPHPDDSWRWAEVDLPPRFKHLLKEMEHIERDPGDCENWRVTLEYWEYVQATALPSEDPGTRIGQ